MTERHWLIIPIETKARELDAKTYLACAAAEAGFRVLLGDQNSLLRRLALLPQGFYLDKSVARLKVKSFQRLEDLGFNILAWCEEGLVYRDRDAYLHERVAPAAFEKVDAFFAWGRVQHDDMRLAVNDGVRKIYETGNPRFDLLRPELQGLYRAPAEALKAQHGNFILINTNFGRYNHFYGATGVMDTLRKRGSIRHAADQAFFAQWIEYLGKIYHAFQDMVPELAQAFPDRTIVVRPHPSEDHDNWRHLAEGLPNVKVIYEGGAIPWLLAAAVSIHNSCTTGLEAALLNRPVIAYQPLKSETYDSFLPNRVSVEATTANDLIDQVRRAFDGRFDAPLAVDEAVQEDVKRYVASIDGPQATHRVVQQLLALKASGTAVRRRKLVAVVRDQSEQWARSVARTALTPLRPTQAYSRQKFPGLDREELERLVENFRALTGRFEKVRILPSAKHSFIVTT
ncbi:surface carbohydrate biosynthesis protein [Pseudorhodoplanes sinuspersici]|uniref:Uncharacterized protein n=1 Tax=Pseudorhodoplanes sinuspersici TaxID=1235591 RepID=A0A1W6ZU98_9HYPH|nr:surface carbohydrate biosynthesis protein [Pseudorhodoplanes sinuspersici]ARQ00701.1 hypothetical protein CAK95_17640 [Pseudorhodoplanes sinuspersici]RKE72309.1 surface carbohydrate biosynthesis protein [Pseudorhodoplanes sinuspersici]